MVTSLMRTSEHSRYATRCTWIDHYSSTDIDLQQHYLLLATASSKILVSMFMRGHQFAMLSFHSCFFVVLVIFKLSCAAGTLIDEMLLTPFENCGSCRAILLQLQALALLGDSAFVDTIVGLCDVLNVRHSSKSSPEWYLMNEACGLWRL